MRHSIQSIKDQYDYILIDTQPSLGMLPINALACALPNFKLKLATHKKFTRRLVVQAFFRVIINPIFDKSDFIQSRFLGSFW
ncbi:hypothetical protein D2A30_07345 [Streptococcus suis]|nr:hypothetical protein D2A30_07345 [Streptococcus suis]